MKNTSIWLDNIKFNKEELLKENKEVDVLIIGGGITGLSTAYHLMDSDLNICLVERNLIAHGITSRTTGKLTYLQENIYTKLGDNVKLYYKSQKDAISLVENIINKHHIDCDFEKVASFIFTNNSEDIIKIKEEQKKLEQLGVDYKKQIKIPLDIKCKYAISVDDTAVFHPLKYLIKIKEIIINHGIKVYENSRVNSIKKDNGKFICDINGKTVRANKVVIASHYPFFLYPYFLPLKTYLEKSYVSASKVNETKKFSAITVSKKVQSIRYHNPKDNKYLIYLNGSHNLCTKYDDTKNFKNLLDELSNMNYKPNYIWSNYDIMTEDNLPYIGYIDDNLLIGTGYNTWGMTNGSIAGKIISDLILGHKNEYISLFDPKRNKKVLNVMKYPLYMSYSAKSFIENKVIKNKSWYSSKVIFTKKNGKNIAIYIDENDKKHMVYNLCPHLKCSLIFNEVEKTWDCPCHGSRFDIDGKCIFGPSKKDIGYKGD